MKLLLVFQACIVLLIRCQSVLGQIPLLQMGSGAFIDPIKGSSKSEKKKEKSEPTSPDASTSFNINSLRSRGEASKSPKKEKKQASMMSFFSSDHSANATDDSTSPLLDRLRAKKSKWGRGNDDDDDHDDVSNFSKSQLKYIQSLFDDSDGNSTFKSFFPKKRKKGEKGEYADDDDDSDGSTKGLAKWFGKKEKRNYDDNDDDKDVDSKKSKGKKTFAYFFGGKSEKKRKFRGTVAPTISPAPAGPPTLPLNMNVLPTVSRPTLPQINIPIPSTAPVVPTTMPATAAPTSTAPSSAPSQTRSCSPTVGPCLETVVSIQEAFDASTGGDTIAICATADPIVVETALVLRQPNTTLCCFNETLNATCTLRSQGSSNTLDVLTASVRLQDLAFENGVGTAGGNTLIDGEGDHVVDGCDFRNGQASRLGGNLFVQADGGSLHILDSTFAEGEAGEFGGGLYVLNARELVVENSIFRQNNVTDEDSSGGGIFMVFDNATAPGQMATFRNTEFRENGADIGGGFFATQLGEMPRLDVIGCIFIDNQARQAAGAGAIAQSLDNYDFRVMSSVGINNAAPVCEDFLGFFDDSTEPECFEAGKQYPP